MQLRNNYMDFESILYGLIFLLIGTIGIVWNAQRPAMEKKNIGWSYSIVKIIISSWMLLLVGIMLVVAGILNVK